MDITKEILNGPEYFYCEKASCKLRLNVCLGRQKANEQRRTFNPMPFLICEDCQQGAKNKLVANKIMMPVDPGKPKRGKGERFEGCEFYKDCLGFAAKKEWKAFNCEACPNYTPERKERMTTLEKPENKRICKECNEKTTISPKHPLCASCLARKGNEAKKAKKAKKNDIEKLKSKSKDQPIDKPKETPLGQNTGLTIEFGKHISTLREIEKLAEEEMRPVEWQVIYMLKNYLKHSQERHG